MPQTLHKSKNLAPNPRTDQPLSRQKCSLPFGSDIRLSDIYVMSERTHMGTVLTAPPLARKLFRQAHGFSYHPTCPREKKTCLLSLWHNSIRNHADNR